MDDPVLAAVQRFMDAVEERLSRSETEIRGMLTELETRAAKLPTEGPPGRDGKDGRDGIDGKDGAPGKDGERGTDGFATPEDLERAVEKLQVRAFADLYQGVYQPDTLYQRSALVTWGGSLFLALNETKARPAESTDWRLIVKAGRDGKR